MSGRGRRTVHGASPMRFSGAIGTFYVGLLALLLIDRFVVRVPFRGYLDVASLFAAANVVLALQRARAGVLAHGTLRSAVLGVLPVAVVGTAVGAIIVAAADSEPATVAVVAGSLLFLVVFVVATAGWQYLRVSSSRSSGDGE
ncbi:MAG TPA: hypothetical protein VKB31_01535 [Trueperaceae bacterium]|nr:hypothetical protein [Trueperaceae bacterium]